MRRCLGWFGVAAFTSLLACSDPTAPYDLNGSYRATAFELQQADPTTGEMRVTDLRRQGARMTVTFGGESLSGGTAAGTIVLPSLLTTSGKADTVPLHGTYTYDRVGHMLSMNVTGGFFGRYSWFWQDGAFDMLTPLFDLEGSAAIHLRLERS